MHSRDFAKLKTEWVGRYRYRCREEAKRSIYFYIEMFYNSKGKQTMRTAKSPYQVQTGRFARIPVLVIAVMLCFGQADSTGAEKSSSSNSNPPNILFIGVDDLRPELNCYGATHIHSPNIDRLANEGVLFERAYAACVSYVDAQIGRLLDELDALGIRDNTIIVLWSDHGYKLGDFGAWAKHTNFELDTRVPLIISAPGLAKGVRSQALVELVDLHPTLSELYEYGKDNIERVNLADRPEHRDLQQSLRNQLHRMLETKANN